MTLGWVEADLGPSVACEIARELVLFARRAGNEAQVSQVLSAQAGERRQVRELVAWIHDNLHRPLTVEALASCAAMSPRTLERCFAREIGRSPARFVAEARIVQARRLLATTTRSLEQVARACGFASADAMRRAFRRFDGVLPKTFRRSSAAAECV
jgi:transcriptional regulator GlxA family with amidase domain